MNEAETRAELIDPALKAAGWGVKEHSRVRREVITLGRLQGAGKRAAGDIADYVLTYRNHKLAVIEAKRRDLPDTEGVDAALPDGATVETGDSDYEPDALVNCGEPMADDAIAAPHPVIIVEVLSPGTASTDTGGKLADYFRVPSVAHYLIVHPTRRTVIHHRRTDAGIDTRIVVNGPITMAPPGIVITVENIYGAE